MTPEEEELGWQQLRERWADEEAHRAWLAGFTDLEGLARAGRRYTAALAENPADPVAVRWRGEVVKRATVHGLASLPRTTPAPPIPRWLVRVGVGVVSSVLAYALYWVTTWLLSIGRA